MAAAEVAAEAAATGTLNTQKAALTDMKNKQAYFLKQLESTTDAAEMEELQNSLIELEGDLFMQEMELEMA